MLTDDFMDDCEDEDEIEDSEWERHCEGCGEVYHISDLSLDGFCKSCEDELG